jgi:hypothetical protein
MAIVALQPTTAWVVFLLGQLGVVYRRQDTTGDQFSFRSELQETS